MTPIICIVGKKRCGKTILIEKLIIELKKRNYKIATLKHDTHGFEVDHPGKDTWRHAKAGADSVTISSPWGVAMMKKVDAEWNIDALMALNEDVDLIIAEGFRLSGKPKIEVVWSGRSTELLSRPDELLAIAADIPLSLENVPVYHIDDAISVANIIEEKIIDKSYSCVK